MAEPMVPKKATLIHIRIESGSDPHLHPWMKRLLQEGWTVVDERFEREEAGFLYATMVLVESPHLQPVAS